MATAHLTSSELLRVRDGLPGSLGETRARSLRDLRAHLGGCLKCTSALLDLHHARARRQRLAHSSPAATDAATTLRDVLQQRDVPPPSAGLDSTQLQAPFEHRRYVFAALIVSVAAVSIWYLRPEPTTDEPTATELPVGGMTVAAGDATTVLMAQSLDLQVRIETALRAQPQNAAQTQDLRLQDLRLRDLGQRIAEIDRALAAMKPNDEARSRLWSDRVRLQQQLLALVGNAESR